MFAPHSRWRALITPTGRGARERTAQPTAGQDKHLAMTWARRLKRAFQIDIECCERCGGRVNIIACIEDPVVDEQDSRAPRSGRPRELHAPRPACAAGEQFSQAGLAAALTP